MCWKESANVTLFMCILQVGLEELARLHSPSALMLHVPHTDLRDKAMYYRVQSVMACI